MPTNKLIRNLEYEGNKETSEWRAEMSRAIYYQDMSMKPMINPALVNKIDEYRNGNMNMAEFHNMFKSTSKEVTQQLLNNGMNTEDIERIEQYQSHIFQPLPILPSKIDGAINIVTQERIEFEISAADALATQKREEDIAYIKSNTQRIQLKQALNDEFGFGRAETEGTKNSSVKFQEAPLGLNLYNAEDLKMFKEFIYKLAPESAYETIIDYIIDIKEVHQLDRLLISDQFSYANSALKTYTSQTTGLVEFERHHPSNVYVQNSAFPDFRDTTRYYIKKKMTPIELMNNFADEINSNEQLVDEILFGDKGYFNSKGNEEVGKRYSRKDYDKLLMNVIEITTITQDWIYFSESGFPCTKDYQVGTVSKKAYQFTYQWHWLLNTDFTFGAQKLSYSFRKKGQEVQSVLDIALYRSAEQSLVQRCIGICRQAQIAFIKLSFGVLKASINGKYIDLKFIRNAAEMLVDESDGDQALSSMSKALLSLAVEENTMIGDTEGFDGANEGQMKPVQEIVGGLKNDIMAYYAIIDRADQFIAEWTGINKDMIGANDNVRTANFARKLNINQGLLSLSHLTLARQD